MAAPGGPRTSTQGRTPWCRPSDSRGRLHGGSSRPARHGAGTATHSTHGSARISADPAAGLCHLIRLEAGSAIEGCLTMDGTALQPPLVGWTEADGPPGGVALVIEGRPHQLIDDVRVNGCQFENFPSGAIYARHTRHVSLSGLSARMMQTKAPKETCAVFAFYD